MKFHGVFCPITCRDTVHNFSLKKPILIRVAHISVETHLVFSNVHVRFIKKRCVQNGENVVDAASRIHDEK